MLDREALYLMTSTQSWAGRNVVAHPELTLLFGVLGPLLHGR